MITYSVTLKDDTLQTLTRAYEQAPEIAARHLMKAVNQSLVNYQSTAKMLAPVRDGTLRGSIQIEPAKHEGSSIKGSVGTNLEYAAAQEAGSGIYGPSGQPIRPRRAKVLAWQSGGKWHFAKSVKGVRPKWYMKGSLEQNQAATDRYFATAADAIARELTGGRA